MNPATAGLKVLSLPFDHETTDVLIGSPDQVAEKIREVAVSQNVGNMILMTQFGNMSNQLARAFARRMDRKAVQPTLSPELAEQLMRLEQSVDTIAVEVERVSEGQRFATRLLSEREKVGGLRS